MILVRDVFQAKYGKGDELVSLFKELRQKAPMRYTHFMTDASGPFFTVVTEAEVASFAEWERLFKQVLSMPEFGPWFNRMTALVESGRREFYNIAQ